jgi:hypothetical protein
MLEWRKRADRCSVVTVTVVVDGYRALPASPTAITRIAKPAKALRSMTCGKLYSCDPLLEGLAQDFQHVAFELGQFIQEEHAVVRQRHLPRHRHLAAADQADIGDGGVGRATRAGRDPRRTVAGRMAVALIGPIPGMVCSR